MPLDTTSRMITPFLDRLTDEEMDALPYGIVQIDSEGCVISYNRAEAENVGVIPRPIGLRFFRDVAPSADVPEFHGRFLHGIATAKLDETFSFTFSCALMPRRVMVRLYYSLRTKSVWLFVANPDGSPFARHTAAYCMSAIRETPAYGSSQIATRVA